MRSKPRRYVNRMRPHYHDSTISRPICEVKHGQVWSVLAWGTSWEVQMLHIFFAFFLGHWFKYHNSALGINYHISALRKKNAKKIQKVCSVFTLFPGLNPTLGV